MKSFPDENSYLETECLFGEKIEILDSYKNWYHCKLETDKYKGWVKKEDLGHLLPPTHRVISKRTFIYNDKNIKSNCTQYLPLGAQLCVNKIEGNWAHINHNDDQYLKNGYVPLADLVFIDHINQDWVKIAENLIETPYRWGGRDTIGIDCSALLQLSYQTKGEDIPRNTKDQMRLNKKPTKSKSNLKRGFVIFWEGHVSIMTDSYNSIHANAYHMKTVVEPLDKIVNRMKNDYKILKIMDFN